MLSAWCVSQIQRRTQEGSNHIRNSYVRFPEDDVNKRYKQNYESLEDIGAPGFQKLSLSVGTSELSLVEQENVGRWTWQWEGRCSPWRAQGVQRQGQGNAGSSGVF